MDSYPLRVAPGWTAALIGTGWLLVIPIFTLAASLLITAVTYAALALVLQLPYTPAVGAGVVFVASVLGVGVTSLVWAFGRAWEAAEGPGFERGVVTLGDTGLDVRSCVWPPPRHLPFREIVEVGRSGARVQVRTDRRSYRLRVDYPDRFVDSVMCGMSASRSHAYR